MLLITVIGLLAVSAVSQERCPPDAPGGGVPRFAEHGNLRWRDERALLDQLASTFVKSPNHVIYFLIYPGLQSCKDEAKLRALRAKKYLVQHHSIPPENISWRAGEFRVDLSVEIWLIPQGKPLPEPFHFMTIPSSELKLHRNCRELRRGR